MIYQMVEYVDRQRAAKLRVSFLIIQTSRIKLCVFC